MFRTEKREFKITAKPGVKELLERWMTRRGYIFRPINGYGCVPDKEFVASYYEVTSTWTEAVRISMKFGSLIEWSGKEGFIEWY